MAVGIHNPSGALRVGGIAKIVKVTPTMDDSPDYSTGDVFGAKMTLTDAVLGLEGTGLLQSIILKSEDTLTVNTVDVIIFDSDPSNTTFTDNSALALADADLPKVIGIIQLNTAYSVDSTSNVLQTTNIALPVQASGGKDLYAVMVARGTINLSVTDGISLAFGFLQD